MNILVVIFWYLPLVILVACLIVARPGLSWPRRLGFILVGYVTSVFTGIVIDVAWGGTRDMPGEAPILALVTGVVAPLIYCFIFGLINKRTQWARAREVEATVQKREINPIIVAAIIQAIASILVALIKLLE